MIDYKQTKAPKTTITRDLNELTEKVGNVYETVAIIGKRSNQISTALKKELDAKTSLCHKTLSKRHLRTKSKLRSRVVTSNCLNLL